MPVESAYRATSSQMRPQRSPYRGTPAGGRQLSRTHPDSCLLQTHRISSIVGGRPVRSNVTRRSNVSLSAGGCGAIRFSSSLLRIKRSIAARAHRCCRGSGGCGNSGPAEMPNGFRSSSVHAFRRCGSGRTSGGDAGTALDPGSDRRDLSPGSVCPWAASSQTLGVQQRAVQAAMFRVALRDDASLDRVRQPGIAWTS